jgi:DNA modification methylase
MEGNARRPIANDDLGAEWEPFIEKIVGNILSVTKGAVYVCINQHRAHTLREVWLGAGGHLSTFLIWSKSHFVMGGGHYHSRYEMMLYGWREGGPHAWYGPDGESNVWEIDKPAANPLHPTQKPVALVARAIRNSSRKREVVLDTCAGSGTTLIAAEQLGRRAACVELDPAYCDVVLERWATATGKRAVLDGTGQAFDEVRASRKGA